MLKQRKTPVSLVIFDCDGVLIDSETVANRIVAQELSVLGWSVTTEECDRLFLGMSYHDMAQVLADRLGHPLPAGWLDRLLARVVDVMETDVTLVPGADAALVAMASLGVAWCVASSSSQQEMAAKFRCTGLTEVVQDRLFSGHDMVLQGKRVKPAPDLFLHAAARIGIGPDACLVVEDSATGIRAARAAGMDCLGFARNGQQAAHAALGAAPFKTMHDLPALLRRAVEPHR